MKTLITWKQLRENMNLSRDYYLSFDKTIFPEKMSFDVGGNRLTYNLDEVIPQSNKVTLVYSKQNKKHNNPYKGYESDVVHINIDLTYPFEEAPKASVNIRGGSNDWVFFEYQDGEINRLSVNMGDVKFLKGSKKSLISSVKKLIT